MDITKLNLNEIKQAAKRALTKHKHNIDTDELTIRQLETEASKYYTHLKNSNAWKTRNKEQLKAYNKEYQNNHREERAAYMRTYRAKKKEDRLATLIANANPEDQIQK
jgi:hypothetical protein